MLEPLVVKATRAVPRRERRSNPPDLSDIGMELYARLIELNSYFVYKT